MSFHDKWCRLASLRITTTSLVILVNGGPYYFFYSSKKDLKHGDSLSPFLFILVMEAFYKMLLKASLQSHSRVGSNSDAIRKDIIHSYLLIILYCLAYLMKRL